MTVVIGCCPVIFMVLLVLHVIDLSSSATAGLIGKRSATNMLACNGGGIGRRFS